MQLFKNKTEMLFKSKSSRVINVLSLFKSLRLVYTIKNTKTRKSKTCLVLFFIYIKVQNILNY